MKSKLPILTLPIIRSWGPCYDPGRYAPQNWTGTALDILRAANVPVEDRLWCVLRREAGVDDRTLRLFACWCASQAIKLIPELERDPRSIQAIEVARRFANKRATRGELAAAWAAARAAARAAAWDAAWYAARAAAWDAASDAAWAAARDAASDAAWAAARDAASDAASDAARDAASAAARAAARAAAWDAAWYAVRAAAWDAQIKQLIRMLSRRK